MAENTSIKLSLLLTLPLFYWCIVKFIEHWYLYGKPFLLDWFKLSSFFSIIFLFVLDASDLSRNTYSVVFETLSVSNEYVIDAVLVYFIAISSIQITQIIFQKKGSRETFFSQKIDLNLKIYFSVFAILIALIQLYFFLKNFDGFGRSSMSNQFIISIVNTFNSANLFVLALAYYLKFYRNNFTKFTFIFVFLASLFTGLISGMKEQTISILIVILFIYLRLGNRLKIKHFTIAIFLLLFIYPLNNNYRKELKYTNSKVVAFNNALNSTFSQKKTSSQDGNREYSLLSRFTGFYPLMYGVSIEPKWNEFKYFNRYLYLPIAWLIPRSILPNKPASNMGGELYGIIRGNYDSNVSVTPSTFGWAYLEGGFVCVFISFFLYALVIISFENYFHSKNTLHKEILFLVLFLGVIKSESDIYFRLSSIFQSVLVVFIFSKLFLNAKKS